MDGQYREEDVEFNFIGSSIDGPAPRPARSPIVSSRDTSSLQGSDHGLELSSNHNTTKSGATSTALTSVEGDLDYETAANEMESVTDYNAPENVLTSMGHHLHDNDSRFQSADMPENPNVRQDFSIAYRETSTVNSTKFFIRLVDISSFLETEIIKLVAVPDYRAARYMIFDWCDPSKPASWTTKKNVAQRTLGGKFGKLTEVLRKAIATTRVFGIRYMWLPTICLITDDAADIKRQHPSMDGIFSYAVALLKAPGSVNHQYIDAKIVQHRIRVIELPECKDSSSAQVFSHKYTLERYLASHDNLWTPYCHYSPIDCFWSASEKCRVLEQLEALLQEGSTSFHPPQALLLDKPGVACVDVQRDGGKLIGIAFNTGTEVSKALLQPINNPRVSPLAFLLKNDQAPRYRDNTAPQAVDCPVGGVREHSAHLCTDQPKRTTQIGAPKDQSFNDLSNDESTYACTNIASRRRKRQHGCAMKCPWIFADLGTDGPGCKRHICERQRHPSVKHFKDHHGKNKDHHHYSSEDMRIPSRSGAGEREKMIYLIFRLVHGWDPFLQPLKEFLQDNQQILILNPYHTKANGECVACDSVEHSDCWRLLEAAKVSMMFRHERPGPVAASSLTRVNCHVSDPALQNELDVNPRLAQLWRVGLVPESQPNCTFPPGLRSPIDSMVAHPCMLPMNEYPTLMSTHDPNINGFESLQWEGVTPYPNGLVLPTMLPPVNPDWSEPFDQAALDSQRIQAVTVFAGIAQPVGQDDETNISELPRTSFLVLQGGQSAGDNTQRIFQSIPALWGCDTGHTNPGAVFRQETSEESSEKTTSEDSLAEEGADNSEPTSLTVPCDKDGKPAQKGVYVPIKICICNDSPMGPDHGHLKCHRNAFCQCCSSFRAYSEEGRRFLEKARETQVCFCEDYLWPQDKHAQCHGKDYCNCCKKWRAYSDEGQVRLNQLMLQLAAPEEDLVPMDAWHNATVLPEQLENIQQELRKLRKGKGRAC